MDEKRLDNIESMLTELLSRINAPKTQSEEKSKRITQLKEQLDDTNRRLTELTASHRKLQDEAHWLRVRLHRLDSEMPKAEDPLAVLSFPSLGDMAEENDLEDLAKSLPGRELTAVFPFRCGIAYGPKKDGLCAKGEKFTICEAKVYDKEIEMRIKSQDGSNTMAFASLSARLHKVSGISRPRLRELLRGYRINAGTFRVR